MDIFRYADLTQVLVNNMAVDQAEEVLAMVMAERATVTGQGKILRFSEFNENPDPLIDELLARIIVGKMDKAWFEELEWDSIAVVSIESSAAYLAGAIAYEIADIFHLSRPPKIVRARKLPKGETPSPALSNTRFYEEVSPITANGESRFLVASLPDYADISGLQLAVVVDDFRATGSTLMGGIALTRKLLSPDRIIPVAALGKPEQETIHGTDQADVLPLITALDINFWGDKEKGEALLQVNGMNPKKFMRVDMSDFEVTEGNV